MEEKGNKKYKAISIRTFGIMMIIVACIMAFILQLSIHNVKDASNQTQESTNDYIDGELALLATKSDSDSMIERVRSFVSTGKKEFLDDYIVNLKDNEARARTFEETTQKLNNTTSYTHLLSAMDRIDEMIALEMHSLKLAISGYGINEKEYSNVLILPELTDEEKKLSDAEKISKANDLLLNDEYQKIRSSFVKEIDFCLNELTEITTRSREENYRIITNLQNRQRIEVTISLILVILDVLTFWIFIVRPLSRNTHHIDQGELLEVKGLEEVQIMADAYNRMYERVEKDKEKLSYEASHDSLTGLLNRNAYNFYMKELDGKDFCFILLDVDDFKGFNDTLGHDMGDRVLQKISRVLSSNVRSEDLVFRLGGDEFTIVLQGAGKDSIDVIEKKMEKIRDDLLARDDRIPEIRISLGATFSSGELDAERVYKEADLALYKAKEEKNKLVFYEDVI